MSERPSTSPVDLDGKAHRKMIRRERNRRYRRNLKLKMNIGDETPLLTTEESTAGRPTQGPRQGMSTAASQFVRAGSASCHDSVRSTAAEAVQLERDAIRPPLTPNVALKSALQDINCALRNWGYPADPRNFVNQFIPGLHRAMELEHGARADWIATVECWILEGDRILDDVQAFIASDTMGSLRSEEAARLWGETIAVSFKLCYVMASVEAQLDQVPYEYRVPLLPCDTRA